LICRSCEKVIGLHGINSCTDCWGGSVITFASFCQAQVGGPIVRMLVFDYERCETEVSNVRYAFDGMLSTVDERKWKGARRKMNLMKYIARRNADAEWKIGRNGYPSSTGGMKSIGGAGRSWAGRTTESSSLSLRNDSNGI
jgi:hypothetical protein